MESDDTGPKEKELFWSYLNSPQMVNALDLIFPKGALSFQKFGIIVFMVSQAGQSKKYMNPKSVVPPAIKILNTKAMSTVREQA